MKVITTGGLLRANSMGAVGPISEHAFEVINVGTAVLGADGMSVEVGATTFDEAEARTASAMAANAQRVVMPVDGWKIGKVPLAKMVPLSQIDHLVTDSTADPGQVELIAGQSGAGWLVAGLEKDRRAGRSRRRVLVAGGSGLVARIRRGRRWVYRGVPLWRWSWL